MKRCILLACCLSLFVLAGCGAKTQINGLDSATDEVKALEATLTPECKTNAIESQINAIKTSIKSAQEECILKIESERHNTIKWKTAFFGLLVVMGIYLLKKIF